jgi:uncharacterized protein (DUF1330 family)
MTSYLVGHITVKNDELWQKYLSGVQESLLPFKSNVIFRGKLAAVLAGKHEHDLSVVIEFPDQNTLTKWYNSKKYQSLIPLRDKAADVVLVSFNA